MRIALSQRISGIASIKYMNVDILIFRNCNKQDITSEDNQKQTRK